MWQAQLELQLLPPPRQAPEELYDNAFGSIALEGDRALIGAADEVGVSATSQMAASSMRPCKRRV